MLLSILPPLHAILTWQWEAPFTSALHSHAPLAFTMLFPVTRPAEPLPTLAGHTRRFLARCTSRVRPCGVRPGQAGPSRTRAGPGRCPGPPHTSSPPSVGRAGHSPAQGRAAVQWGSRGLVPAPTRVGQRPAHGLCPVPAGGGGEEEEKGRGRQEEARAGGDACWGRGFPGQTLAPGAQPAPHLPPSPSSARGEANSPLAREAPRGPHCDGPLS